MTESAVASSLLTFLTQSPTPFHATENLKQLFLQHGFNELNEKQDWQLVAGQKYFFTRSDSSIVAFIKGSEDIRQTGIRMVGAHTDSPCLKVKPQPEKLIKNYAQLGVEVYGGVLLNPWFDRDLSIAGKVSFLNKSGKLQSHLINFKSPIAIVPNLAIHLDREANIKRTVNPQTDMSAILLQSDEKIDFRQMLQQQLEQEGCGDVEEVLDFNLSFYDVQAPGVVGFKSEFISSARLDNLLSCFVASYALTQADTRYSALVVCNDHEEVGSNTDIGAQGTMVDDTLQRLVPDSIERQLVLRKSLMFSVDNAHGVHPNYLQKHDEQHGPLLNKGPVLKFDANQCYATSSDSAAFVRATAKQAGVPLQTYVTRADMRCGSTIGPITASNLGIKTVDIGVPTFGMHSIRELAGYQDIDHLASLLSQFYATAEVSV
ncbi:putative M18 family aminopeptidase 2 [Thalassocella blandensis]|nr:putative M18 family aminopeptidase 2 [Thalassocella blandensis]